MFGLLENRLRATSQGFESLTFRLKWGSAPNPAVTAGMNPASTALRGVARGATGVRIMNPSPRLIKPVNLGVCGFFLFVDGVWGRKAQLRN